MRLIIVGIAAVVLPVGATLLYLHSPETARFYPPCPLFWATGLYCPGCGVTRSLAALTHGNFAQAFAFNPLVVVALPVAGFWIARFAYEMWTDKQVEPIIVPTWMAWVIFAGVVAFWLARNIDVYPCTLLAPHELAAEAPG